MHDPREYDERRREAVRNIASRVDGETRVFMGKDEADAVLRTIGTSAQVYEKIRMVVAMSESLHPMAFDERSQDHLAEVIGEAAGAAHEELASLFSALQQALSVAIEAENFLADHGLKYRPKEGGQTASRSRRRGGAHQKLLRVMVEDLIKESGEREQYDRAYLNHLQRRILLPPEQKPIDKIKSAVQAYWRQNR